MIKTVDGDCYKTNLQTRNLKRDTFKYEMQAYLYLRKTGLKLKERMPWTAIYFCNAIKNALLKQKPVLLSTHFIIIILQ
jgi:hypothetical protein